MIERGQVFIRAQDEDGKWGSFDILDLDEDSWRRWVLAWMVDPFEPVRLANKGGTAPFRTKPGIKRQ